MNCKWECLRIGCKCLHGCGYALRRNYDTAPVRTCKAAPPPTPACPHLLEATGESVPVKQCGCGAMTAVFECALYVKCAPIVRKAGAYIEVAEITLCRDCPDNPANAAAT